MKKFKEPHVEESHVKKALVKIIRTPQWSDLSRKPSKRLEMLHFQFNRTQKPLSDLAC